MTLLRLVLQVRMLVEMRILCQEQVREQAALAMEQVQAKAQDRVLVKVVP